MTSSKFSDVDGGTVNLPWSLFQDLEDDIRDFKVPWDSVPLQLSFSHFCQNWIKDCLFLVSLLIPKEVSPPLLSPCFILKQFIALAMWEVNLSSFQPFHTCVCRAEELPHTSQIFCP